MDENAFFNIKYFITFTVNELNNLLNASEGAMPQKEQYSQYTKGEISHRIPPL